MRTLQASLSSFPWMKGALENASYYGADRVLNLQKGKNIGKELKSLTGGVDVLIDFSGHSANIEESLRAMNPGGRIVLVGIGRNPLQFKIPLVLIEKMISILGSYGSDRRAIPELIELVESGNLYRYLSSTILYSAKLPFRSNPNTPSCLQKFSLPDTQYSQLPQEVPAEITTRSPFLNFVILLPISRTSPEASCPGIAG